MTEIAGTPIVALREVTKYYRQGTMDVPALRGLTLAIQKGEFTAICGPSGASAKNNRAISGREPGANHLPPARASWLPVRGNGSADGATDP